MLRHYVLTERSYLMAASTLCFNNSWSWKCQIESLCVFVIKITDAEEWRERRLQCTYVNESNTRYSIIAARSEYNYSFMSSASNLQWINDASPRWWKKGEARLDFIHLCHVCRVTGWLFCFHVVSRKSHYISTGCCTFDALSLHRFPLFTIFVTFLHSFNTPVSSRTRSEEIKSTTNHSRSMAWKRLENFLPKDPAACRSSYSAFSFLLTLLLHRRCKRASFEGMLKQPEKANLRNENAISRFNDLLIRAKLEIQARRKTNEKMRNRSTCEVASTASAENRPETKNTFMAMK